MKDFERRVKALEQAGQVQRSEEFRDTNGAEFGLEWIEGGWTILVQNGKFVKAWPKLLWDAW